MSTPTYPCDSVDVDGQLCWAKASVAYYVKRWRFACTAHVYEVDAYPPAVRKSLMALTEESADDLLLRSLPCGEDR
jgi:hypothetical protein